MNSSLLRIGTLFKPIDCIQDTCHLCTHSRIDGIKAMSSGISGSKQAIKFANTRNSGQVTSYSQNEMTILVIEDVQFKFQ